MVNARAPLISQKPRQMPKDPAKSTGAGTGKTSPQADRLRTLQALASNSAPVQRFARLQRQAASTQAPVIQCAQSDYARLWTKDPSLAKLAINQASFDSYLEDAKAFEQGLGAGLFNHALADQGADALIDAIETLLGSAGAANAAFGANPKSKEAGAIPSEKVAEARGAGNLREKMYMVYAAIRSGAVARKLAERDVRAVPKKRTKAGAVSKTLAHSPGTI